MSRCPESHVLLMGQTPPPWHGQAVATQILFDHDWPDHQVHRLRMEFSEEMQDVGRFQWKKLHHLYSLIRKARRFMREHPGAILFYPPASAKWVPFLRDVIFLNAVRPLAGSTVFIYHASGLPVFVEGHWLRRLLGRRVYGNADVSLEVSQEMLPPHRAFHAKSWEWCPCAIEIHDVPRQRPATDRRTEVLFVASLQEGKGVLEILRTAALLKERGRAGDFRFRIVGRWFSSEFETTARQLHTELGLENLVEFVGQLTGDDKWQAYADADVFFFPTHYASEATPIVLMEALGTGLPIVTTRWAGIPAMLDGCGTARLLPVRAPAEFASALEDLACDPSQAARTSELSKSFYRAHFIPERFIHRIEGAFGKASVQEAAKAAPTGAKPRGVHAAANPQLAIAVYLADQNPKLGRSLGISRMTEVLLKELVARKELSLTGISSRSSIQMPEGANPAEVPWSTRGRFARVITDHLHPLWNVGKNRELWYYPKGFLPKLHRLCSPSVVTIHDTIIQYYADHYPEWRTEMEYRYWASMLRHTLRHADAILTISEAAKCQIREFMERHRIPPKEITVTYEPCLYESVPQPQSPAKADYVLHLGSNEPHKRTAWLIRLWAAAAMHRPDLPNLHVVGKIPAEVAEVAHDSPVIVPLPFLDDIALRSQFIAARALIFPSEIEGFGLPAVEAYYLGTPVCYTAGTSVEEVLGPAGRRGGFALDDPDSVFQALDEVLALSEDEVFQCGMALRQKYAARVVVDKMVTAFRDAAARH